MTDLDKQAQVALERLGAGVGWGRKLPPSLEVALVGVERGRLPGHLESRRGDVLDEVEALVAEAAAGPDRAVGVLLQEAAIEGSPGPLELAGKLAELLMESLVEREPMMEG